MAASAVDFAAERPVGLDFLKNDLMVVLNCTDISARVREDLFMPSRDRLRECQAKRSFEEALEAYLGEHAELARLNRERREAELRDRLADDKPLTEALKSIIDSSPELKALFRLGAHVPAATVPGDREQEFTGANYPTFFRLVRREESAAFITFECALTGGARIRFETDAVNDYFTRPNDPGTLVVSPLVLFDRVALHNGKATLVLKCPPRAAVGDQLDVLVEVTDSQQQTPFASRFHLRITEDPMPREPGDTPPPPRTGALALPKVVEVTEEDWAGEEFGPESGLAIQRDVDGGLVAKVNVDNVHLKQFLLRNPRSEVDLMRKRFVYGLVLAGVSLWQEYRDDENCDELIRTGSVAMARVLLPMIVVLGSLDEATLAPVRS